MSASIVDDINRIGEFLAHREGGRDDPGAVNFDFIVLCGSQLLDGAAAASKALSHKSTAKICVTGGIGHSTGLLYDAVRAASATHPACAEIPLTTDRSEAEVIQDVLVRVMGIGSSHIIVETESTNCGENARCTRELLDSLGLKPSRILIIQDPTMQLRTEASFKKWWADWPEVGFQSFAPFVPTVAPKGIFAAGEEPRLSDLELVADGAQWPLWSIERYISLLSGEIPRLRDDEAGYGPRGRGFIAHVDIPPDVEEAYARMMQWAAKQQLNQR